METTDCPLCSEKTQRHMWEKNGAHYVECKNCGLVYENPRFSSDEFRAYYSQESYFIWKDKNAEPSGYLNYFSQCTPALVHEYFRILKRHSPRGRKIRYLDIGCGPGKLLTLALQNGWDSVGLEISKWAVDVGRHDGLQIFEGTLLDAKFPGESFDVISMFDVLEHLPFPREYVTEIRRILKPGGVVVAETPNIRGIFAWHHYREKSELVKPRAHICLYSPQTVNRLFRTGGFSRVAVQTFPYCRKYTPGYFKSFLLSLLGAISDSIQLTFNESMRIVAWK